MGNVMNMLKSSSDTLLSAFCTSSTSSGFMENVRIPSSDRRYLKKSAATFDGPRPYINTERLAIISFAAFTMAS